MEQDINRANYNAFYEELNRRNLSNSQMLDKSILTLSSTFLALSLTFTHSLFETIINSPGLIITSWILLGVAIASTIASFLVSQLEIDKCYGYAEEYYLYNQDSGKEKIINSNKNVNRLNYLSSISFILGIIFNILFIICNTQLN